MIKSISIYNHPVHQLLQLLTKFSILANMNKSVKA